MALIPSALAATALGAVALVGGLAATSGATPAVAPAAVPIVSLGAADDTTQPALGWRWFSRLTAEQKACLDKAGLTRPIGPLSDAEKAKVQADLRAAATTCGIKLPTGERRAKIEAWWKSLSSDQQSCLKAANLTRPLGPLSDAERKALRQDLVAAAKKCNITLPAKPA